MEIKEPSEHSTVETQKGMEDRVVAKIQHRRERGLSKYGVGVERSDLTRSQWLTHAQEEALDLAIYLEKLLSEQPSDAGAALLSKESEVIEQMRVWIIGILCPYCNNQGWFARPDSRTGEPEQVQCQWCHERESILALSSPVPTEAAGETR